MNEPGVQRDGPGDVGQALGRPTGRRRSDRIVGASRTTREVVEQAMAAAGNELGVRISGLSGSGKIHVARAIHAWSSRGSGPLVTLASSAGILKITCDVVFVTFLLAVLPGEHQVAWTHVLVAVAIAAPTIALMTEMLPLSIARAQGDRLLIAVLPAFAVERTRLSSRWRVR